MQTSALAKNHWRGHFLRAPLDQLNFDHFPYTLSTTAGTSLARKVSEYNNFSQVFQPEDQSRIFSQLILFVPFEASVLNDNYKLLRERIQLIQTEAYIGSPLHYEKGMARRVSLIIGIYRWASLDEKRDKEYKSFLNNIPPIENLNVSIIGFICIPRWDLKPECNKSNLDRPSHAYNFVRQKRPDAAAQILAAMEEKTGPFTELNSLFPQTQVIEILKNCALSAALDCLKRYSSSQSPVYMGIVREKVTHVQTRKLGCLAFCDRIVQDSLNKRKPPPQWIQLSTDTSESTPSPAMRNRSERNAVTVKPPERIYNGLMLLSEYSEDISFNGPSDPMHNFFSSVSRNQEEKLKSLQLILKACLKVDLDFPQNHDSASLIPLQPPSKILHTLPFKQILSDTWCSNIYLTIPISSISFETSKPFLMVIFNSYSPAHQVSHIQKKFPMLNIKIFIDKYDVFIYYLTNSSTTSNYSLEQTEQDFASRFSQDKEVVSLFAHYLIDLSKQLRTALDNLQKLSSSEEKEKCSQWMHFIHRAAQESGQASWRVLNKILPIE